MTSKKKLLYITTIPNTFTFLNGQIGYMDQNGFEVYGICSPGTNFEKIKENNPIKMYPLKMTRSISPIRDIIGLIQIIYLVFKIKPYVINASTPKAGLLGVIAGKLTRTKVLIYTLRGVRYRGEQGLKRIILKFLEKISCSLAHFVLSTSNASMNFVIKDKVCRKDKIKVILKGTGNGISLEKFDPARFDQSDIRAFRSRFNVREDDYMVGYVGRIIREKGIEDLLEAWKLIDSRRAKLVIVGNFEPHDTIGEKYLAQIENTESIIKGGYIHNDDIPIFFKSIDVIVLPSYREGFGITPLEAAAMGRPSIVTAIDGLSESVIRNVTGIQVPVKSPNDLADAIESLRHDPERRIQLGNQGRKRIEEYFENKKIWKELHEFYWERISAI